MKRIAHAASLLVAALALSCYSGGGDGGSTPTKPNPPSKNYFADCICQDNDNYLNAHFYRTPLGGEGLRAGDIVTVTARGCEWLSACPVRALTGTMKIKLNGWTSNTAYVYKFTMHGPGQ